MLPRLAIGGAVLALAAGCGGGPPSAESVVRAWSEALNSGDNEAAADLFAPGAEVVQGVSFVLETRAEAMRFNAALPCSGEIVELVTEGDTVTATFVLGDRETSACDAPGAEAVAAFRIREGKIVLWHQLPGSGQAPGAAV
ncbi:MAG: nuclear transport factor 2 family protein [Gaiellaceae bacterium]